MQYSLKLLSGYFCDAIMVTPQFFFLKIGDFEKLEQHTGIG